MIDGISQTTGIERLVQINAAEAGVRLGIRDRKLNTELANVTIPTDALMSILSDQPQGSHIIAGAERSLEIEVRRNEVWLTIGGPDAAVGLDDLIDAVAGALPSTF